jgi:hypothetical protein
MARLGPFPAGSRCWQAASACWKSGALGLSEVETVIVIVPEESGPGKLGTPCERMQSAYFTPAAVPTVVEILVPIAEPPGGGAKASLLAPLPPALLEVVVTKLATDGDFEPPPQAERSNASIASAPAMA